MKDIDMVEKLKLFEDTMQVVDHLRIAGEKNSAKHLHELWTLAKHLGAEVKRLRKEKNT